MVFVFSSPNLTDEVMSKIKEIRQVRGTEPTEDACTTSMELPTINEADAGLRNRSPFKLYFKALKASVMIPTDVPNRPSNKFKNEEALVYLASMWLPLYGLWGVAVLNGTKFAETHLTNARVESWFA